MIKFCNYLLINLHLPNPPQGGSYLDLTGFKTCQVSKVFVKKKLLLIVNLHLQQTRTLNSYSERLAQKLLLKDYQ